MTETLTEDDTEELACECFNCQYPDMTLPTTCDECGTVYDRSQEGWARFCEPCTENRCCNCECDYDDCECENYDDDDDHSSAYVHNYNYRPSLNFLAVDAEDASDQLFMGWELEVATDHSGEVAELVNDTAGEGESVLFCKEDGSISGVEIVSHPMTHRYFREQFDTSMFERGSAVSNLLRWRRPNAGYGLHVHVSRAAFKKESHALRWLLLIYRNEAEMSKLARRTSDEWSKFSDKKFALAKARNRNPAETVAYWADRGYVPQRAEQHARQAREDALRYGPSCYSGDRYVAVNAQNRETFEVRVFRSSFDLQEFSAALDFVHASVKYTEQLTATDVLRDGLTWHAFRDWVTGRPEYLHLIAELERIALLDEPDDYHTES